MTIGRLFAALAAVWFAVLSGPVMAQPDAAPVAVSRVADAASANPARVTDPAIPPGDLAHLLIPLTKPELAEVTDRWLANVRAATQDIADLQADIRRCADLQQIVRRSHPKTSPRSIAAIDGFGMDGFANPFPPGPARSRR